MKLARASDLHLEFGDINLINDEDADVLILGGDIMIAQDLHDHPEPINTLVKLGSRQQSAQRYRAFLKRCSEAFPHVIYVAGNHEFYHGKFHASLDDLYNECSKFPNVYFMENDLKVINGVNFVGCTLWTDMNKGDPLTLNAVANMMNDYRIIKEDSKNYTKLRPAQTMARHRNSMQYIRNVVVGRDTEKFVVIGHMAPSFLSVHEKYKNDTVINGAYASDLSEFILDNPQIKIWTHGHTHHNFDYMIGTTRIVCNPRGYEGYEVQAENFKLQYLEL